MSDRRSIMASSDRGDGAPAAGLCTRIPHDLNEQERLSRLTRTIEGEIVPRLLISSAFSHRSGALETAAELTRVLAALARLETALRDASAAPPEAKL